MCRVEIHFISRFLVAAESGELSAEFLSLIEVLSISMAVSHGTVTLPEPW